ncbi:MAG: hypothetical protein ABH824_02980 [Nanoarchaeota archaeon]|nr:hypothetical protein [Nanoarchaeota archaeon]MBU1631744.1 hypothetical protein [Nanoarchaeota archaeon]MBU1875548.1 hypothetical protein [Nanoarchaeota archaeon]
MVEESAFRGIVGFMGKIGIYDVILPFLLVFTIVFAILEKTKIFGAEKIDGRELTKKNINSIVAFVVAFLVIASTKLVSVINEVMANVVLLLILAVCFLMLVGTFFGDKEFTLEKFPTWTKIFMVLMFIGVVVIFLNALDWLKFVFALFENWDTEWAASIIFMIIILGFIAFITNEPRAKETKKSE